MCVRGDAPESAGATVTGCSRSAYRKASYDDLPPGNLDPNHQPYPGQVDGHGCIYPSFVHTIAGQLDRP